MTDLIEEVARELAAVSRFGPDADSEKQRELRYQRWDNPDHELAWPEKPETHYNAAGEEEITVSKQCYRDLAKAVIPIIQKRLIEEMMEPSEDICEAGRPHVMETFFSEWGHGYKPKPKECWQAMLKAYAKQKGVEIDV